MNKHIQQICLQPTATIQDALVALSANKPAETNIPGGVVLVVSQNGRLQGIATDGDIRRALASGIKPETAISRVANKEVFYVEEPADSTEILTAATQKIRDAGWHASRLEKIVIVDKKRQVLDLVSFFDVWQSSDVRAKRVGIIGLGFVGLTLGLTLADLGFDVLGFDKSARHMELIKAKKPPFFEVGLDSLLKDHMGKRFRLVTGFDGKDRADIYFIAVGTPVGEDHKPSMEYVSAAAEELGAVLKKGDTIILRSTVPLGTTRDVVTPILERVSGLVAGTDFLIAFAPERTVEGKALEELRTLPQVVGGINRASANSASAVFNLMTDTVYTVDTLEEAEMVKLINNTYRDVTFAFANELSLVCQKWGIDTNKVINAANMGYARSNVPKPSPGVGGYCLEKDPFIFIESAKRRGYSPMIARDARTVNEAIVVALGENIAGYCSGLKKKSPRIFILGFAFKGNPPTSDMRGSSTVKIVKFLHEKGLKNIVGFDPQIEKKDIEALGVGAASSPADGARDADVVIVMTNHPLFRELNMRNVLARTQKPVLLFDAWALFNKEEMQKVEGMVYRHL